MSRRLKTVYSDKLPRKAQNSAGAKCQWLEGDGERCKRKARYEVTIHENPEHRVGTGGAWFAVLLCEDHADDDDIKEANL